MRAVRIATATATAVVLVLISGSSWAETHRALTVRKLRYLDARRSTSRKVLVKYRSSPAMTRALSEGRIPGRVRKRFARFSLLACEMSGKQAAELARDPEVEYIEAEITFYLDNREADLPNARRLRVGRSYKYQADLSFFGVTPTEEYQHGLAQMGVRPELHEAGYLGRGIKVGIIDTGIDGQHPDLDVRGGWSFVGGTDSPAAGDVLGHGTHVAGIIAARRNGFGVVGVAPEAELYSIRVFTIFGTASTVDIIEGIQWGIDRRMNILNMSFGSSRRSAAMKDVLQQAHDAGILLVASAGNSGRSNDDVMYPAKLEEVIAVSAIDGAERIANFSSRGPAVELAAPGVDVLSTFNTPPYYEHTYYALSGTSMACPHVVGLAALIWSANPGMTNEEVRQRLSLFAKDLGADGRDIDYGWGVPQVEPPGSVSRNGSPRAEANGPYRGVVGEPVHFSAAGTLDPDDSVWLEYRWDFGDGGVAQGLEVDHAYAAPGAHEVTLTVRDRQGHRDTDVAPVDIRAGRERSLRLVAVGEDTGYLRSPSGVYLGKSLIAGVSSGRKYQGVARFEPPSGPANFLLSADVALNGTTRSPREEGVITAGFLPADVAGGWPGLTYEQAADAPRVLLDPPIRLSPLGGQVGEGLSNTFSLSHYRLNAVERSFEQGSMVLRVDMETALSGNRVSWTHPELSLRYLEDSWLSHMPPVAEAGNERRYTTGEEVVLDGSRSFDPEGAPLTYQWIQIEGPAVDLETSPESPEAAFTAPAGDHVLEFQLTVSDGDLSSSDTVQIYTNAVPAKVHRIVVTPGPDRAGFVEEDLPDLNFFNVAVILSGSLAREPSQGRQTEAVGALQFDLSRIPEGSQVLSAKMELTGAKRRPEINLQWEVQLLEPSVDGVWEDLDYNSFKAARALLTLDPILRTWDLEEDKVNAFTLAPALLEDRRATTNKLSFRINGPTRYLRSTWEWFVWWTAKRDDMRQKAPRLIVDYGAVASGGGGDGGQPPGGGSGGSGGGGAGVPTGRNSLNAQIFLDVGCDRYFRNGMDRPLEGAGVTIAFPNGAELTGATNGSGLANLSGFDASGGVVASVSFPETYRGYRLESCPNSPETIELTGRDFSSGSKLVQFRAQAVR